jgi:effector-binding domain-containing protein
VISGHDLADPRQKISISIVVNYSTMIDTPQITQVAAQQMAFIHVVVSRAEIQEVMGPGISEVLGALTAQGITPTGPWFTHHLKMPSDTFDFEICVPVSTPVAAVGRVKAGQLPAMTVARTVYQGGYEGLGSTWGEFMDWIRAEGHNPAPDLLECYVKGPESGPDSSTYRTELSRPLISHK